MSRASTHTLLALDKYAQIVGINPAHFNTADVGTCMPVSSSCDDLWYQYSWQSSDRASREDVAYAISQAEDEIANVVGYYPAPRWFEDEVHQYPRHHRPDVQQMGGLNVYGQRKSVTTNWGKVVTVGRRATTLIGTATVAAGTLVYSDADGDGCTETVTITLPTTLTDACELKAYFPGYSAAPEWEIRPYRTKAITGGSIVMTFWTWQFILPELWEQFTTGTELDAIDAGDTDNLIITVQVYQEYTDTTTASCQLFWEPQPRNVLVIASCDTCGGAGCEACAFTTQDGCLHVRNNDSGLVVPQPAEYSASDASWSQVAFSVCRDPDLVKLWYYAGDLDRRYLAGQTCDPLSDWWAQTIAMLTTARLTRPLCSCASRVTAEWREDLALVNTARSYQTPADLLTNPFGTRRGELIAWQRVQRILKQHNVFGGAI